MSDILGITFPIYAAVIIGYLVVRIGWFKAADMRVLGQYVLNVALPALLFNAVAGRDLGEVLRPGYLLVMAVGGLVTIAVAWLWFSATAPDKPRRALAVMGASCPNSGFVGYPVLLLVLPDLAGVVLALNFLVENVLIIPICLILMDLAAGRAGVSPLRLVRDVLLGLLKRPMVIGLLLGLAVSALGVAIPAPLTRMMGMLAASAAALSLIVIGGSLVGLPMKGNKTLATQIAAAKLLLHPAAVAMAALALPVLGFVSLSEEMRSAAILSAAMPMFGIYTVLAQERGLGGAASIAMLAATAAAFFTLSVFLFWLT
ncbi:AEC family transporter [Antarcticimicrobium sediminis]|uniref:Transporter n=1 Tax=Antarcticimicrobium sediminis TaxID=2546227 RepID=A0A4R5ER31_9RHOB|nr:AEC family transporter [Antarcticimicrobium sediminis]TDE37043.1 transporter [Antarcticimicrobium sediminis]